jgi:two-component system, NarL family, sensor kinase
VTSENSMIYAERVMSRAGQVESELLAAIGRFAGPVRGVSLLVISVFGVLTVPDHALWLGFTLLALMVAGTVADFQSARLAQVLAVVRTTAVCLAQAEFGPESATWALNALTTTAITLQWEWPPKATVPVTAALLVLSGAVIGVDDGMAAALRVVVECVLARLAFLLLRRSSRHVDELRASQAQLKRDEAVALERRRQEREYLALLHDTAASTFLMVAVHANPTDVAGYARRDLAMLTDPARESRNSEVDVAASLRALVDHSRLTVRAHWETVLAPTSVALALVRAVRETLANVERHAGTDTVELSVRAEDKGVTVTVTDAGHGFDVQDVPTHRRGIRSSIVERMTAVGGNATVTSQRGSGTTVRLVWSRD